VIPERREYRTTWAAAAELAQTIASWTRQTMRVYVMPGQGFVVARWIDAAEQFLAADFDPQGAPDTTPRPSPSLVWPFRLSDYRYPAPVYPVTFTS